MGNITDNRYTIIRLRFYSKMVKDFYHLIVLLVGKRNKDILPCYQSIQGVQEVSTHFGSVISPKKFKKNKN